MPRYVSNLHSFLMRVTLACAAALALAACDRGTGQSGNITEMQWARIALERNPQIEVVASDPQGALFTIRDRATGEVKTIKLTEIAAAPIAQLAAPTSSATGEAAPAAAQPVTAPAPPAAPEPDGGPASTAAVPTPSETPSTAATAPAEQATEYTIERTDGQLKVSGPGISIVSSGTAASASAQGQAGQKSVDPIICEGRRTLHLDNRTIYVEGDAVTARGGCELYITNSRIVASGTGVIADEAVVHIYNTYVEGGTASFEAGIGAKLYVRGSTFKGMSRRDSLASIQDQGGNQWR